MSTFLSSKLSYNSGNCKKSNYMIKWIWYIYFWHSILYRPSTNIWPLVLHCRSDNGVSGWYRVWYGQKTIIIWYFLHLLYFLISILNFRSSVLSARWFWNRISLNEMIVRFFEIVFRLNEIIISFKWNHYFVFSEMYFVYLKNINK